VYCRREGGRSSQDASTNQKERKRRERRKEPGGLRVGLVDLIFVARLDRLSLDLLGGGDESALGLKGR
jgi:hypothetical protein